MLGCFPTIDVPRGGAAPSPLLLLLSSDSYESSSKERDDPLPNPISLLSGLSQAVVSESRERTGGRTNDTIEIAPGARSPAISGVTGQGPVCTKAEGLTPLGVSHVRWRDMPVLRCIPARLPRFDHQLQSVISGTRVPARAGQGDVPSYGTSPMPSRPVCTCIPFPLHAAVETVRLMEAALTWKQR